MEEEDSKQIMHTINDLTVKINDKTEKLNKSIQKTLGEKQEYCSKV